MNRVGWIWIIAYWLVMVFPSTAWSSDPVTRLGNSTLLAASPTESLAQPGAAPSEKAPPHPALIPSRPSSLRIASILIAGSLSYLGGLVFILCSQADPRTSKLAYLRFWSHLFSRSQWLKKLFLSSPFAPTPAAPNVIFIFNGVASTGIEIYRLIAVSKTFGIWEGILSHGALVWVFTLVNTNNILLALSLHGNGEPYRYSLRDKICIAGAAIGVISLVWSAVLASGYGMQAGMPAVWVSLGSSIFVRSLAVFSFIKNFEQRLRDLLNPQTRAHTRPIPPAYGYHFFLAGAILAWLTSAHDGLNLIHPTFLLAQTALMSCYLEWVTYRWKHAQTTHQQHPQTSLS